MRSIVGLFVGFTLVLCVTLSGTRAFAAEAVDTTDAVTIDDRDDDPTTGDAASKVLQAVERARGASTGSPIEEELRGRLEELSAMEQGAAGGFEPPPEDGTPPPQDDSQYNALKELMQKMTPVERVKAGVWFLVIQPRTPHRDDVMKMIDQQAAMLTGPEAADYRDYMQVRRGLAGASFGQRIDKWQEYVKGKPSSAFADVAKREIQHIQSIQQDKADEGKNRRGKFLVKIGIVAIVLALVAVIIFGAAR